MLSVPRAARVGQRLYREILRASTPELFDLPTKNSLGLDPRAPKWRRRFERLRLGVGGRIRQRFPGRLPGIDPRLNYLDWDLALRRRADLRELVGQAVAELERRACLPWLDVGKMWKEHCAGVRGHADALTLLTCLETCLRVGPGSDADLSRENGESA